MLNGSGVPVWSDGNVLEIVVIVAQDVNAMSATEFTIPLKMIKMTKCMLDMFYHVESIPSR